LVSEGDTDLHTRVICGSKLGLDIEGVDNAVTANAAAGGNILVPPIIDSGMDLCITFLHGDRAKRLISLLVRVLRTFLSMSN